ncbi:hypothetical protein CROQUDRAFT_35271 [Cronartium quercuum f. sp. fusiforme G11]|uniref:RNA-dependent RNA polymerase n=1 Tax=Cronartium quercuum f. sp. fusiforme G11 TaxID=708437 RepID=A0A9P6NVQ6_9BASI|nr:hypothetical protein CROQUDRAFT_35271 [Cronartium quercuum f. sp. fusiforme G11]
MELYINELPNHSHLTDIRLELIDSISNVLHQQPFKTTHLKSNQKLINFDVLVRQNYIRTYQNNYNRSQSKYSAIVTFPTINIVKQFEDYVEKQPISIFDNFMIHFKRSSIGGRSIIPHPELIRHLKETPFKDRIQVLEEQLEHEKLLRPFSISCLEFGRPSKFQGKLIFSSEHALYLATGDSLLNFDTINNSLIIKWPTASTFKSLIIKMKSIQRIEADQLSVILWMDCPPTFERIEIDQNHQFDYEEQDDGFQVKTRYRIACPNHNQEHIFPYVCDRIRITFGTHKAFKEFCTRKSIIRLPKIVYCIRPSIEQNLYSLKNLAKLQDFLICFSIQVGFQIETILSHSLLNPNEILMICKSLKGIDSNHAERALIKFVGKLTQLQSKADDADNEDNDEIKDNEYDYLDILSDSLKSTLQSGPQDPRIISGDCFPCRTVIITPTRFIFEGPITERSNSVLRNYGETHNFIRITIRDENGLRLRVDRDVEISSLLKSRYSDILIHGLQLCGRVFEFLGYSSSALREHQAWFVCPFYKASLITAASIRDRLGDFSKVIHIPARYMARVAQAFTSTRKSLTLLPSQIIRIEDVERGGSCFTDGVGTISPDLAQQVNEALSAGMPLRKRKDQARSTCFQIRLGGFKGMLSVDSALNKSCVCVRPSMDKFSAPESLTLDIVDTFTRPLPAYLNRPMVKVLEDLGIHEQVFLSLQRTMLQTVERSRTNMRRASELMRSLSLAHQSGLSNVLKQLGNMLGDESDPCSEFIEECYDLMIMQSLRDLKYRARIPLKDSFTLVGVADEDEILAPNSIYACVQFPGKTPIYLEGPITISRSPCLHPGDIRVVSGVGQLDSLHAPRLSKLVNCVVFSVKGVRSLPSCLGGGDLDGDLYTLITLPELIPPSSKLHPPASYAPPQMKRLDRPCTIQDGAEFFLDYISSDLVGVIASRHLHVADQQEEGTKDDKCIELAALHSDAVDYPKTGVAVSIDRLPRAESRLKPDFMCPEHYARRKGDDYYESTKVLGKLFRQIPAEKIDIFHRTRHSGGIESYTYTEVVSRSRFNKGQPFGKVDPTGTISKAIKRGVRRATHQIAQPDLNLLDEFKITMESFGEDLMRICKLNTLSRKKNRHLSETEAFMGVITDTTSDKKLKKSTVDKLEEQTEALFDSLRAGIIGFRDERSGYESDTIMLDTDPKDPIVIERERQINRAYTAWHVATSAEPQTFGAHSFGFIALSILLSRF